MEGLRSSGLNLLWVAFKGFGKGAVAGVSSVGAGGPGLSHFLVVLPTLDGFDTPLGVGGFSGTATVIVLEASVDGGRLVGTVLSDFNATGSKTSSTWASSAVGSSGAN